MEVKIGVQNVNRELVLDTDQTGEDIEALVAKALSEDEAVISLTDKQGRKVIVPTEKVAYVELGSPTIGQVGFRSRPGLRARARGWPCAVRDAR